MRRSWVIITIGLAVTACASSAEAKLDLYVDKSTQRIAVVQDGYMRYIWPVSTGRDSYATPNGVYAPERLERSWFSKAYYNSPMPYSIFFHNGYAIHGSYDIARLGGPASHGCVRLYPQHAEILFAMVEQERPGNTTIVIGGDSQPNPRVPRYREMDDVFRSAGPGDGGFAKGSSAMRPQTMPYYDTGHYVEAPDRQRGGSGQFVARGVYRSPAPRSDFGDSNEPARRMRGEHDGPANDRANPSVIGRPPSEQPQPSVVGRPPPEQPQPSVVGRPPSEQPQPSVVGRPPSEQPQPSVVGRPPSEQPQPSVVGRPPSEQPQPSMVGRPPPEQPQPSYGYTILPKSYWTGASWRWRSKPDQEMR
jgi:L,D-transpeptidase catalytic domain